MLSGFIPLTILTVVSGFPLEQEKPNGPRPTDVFVIAHEDDWQLFMGDVVFKGVRRGNQSVFIYLTAGNQNPDAEYWTTRERAALRSTRLAAGTNQDSATVTCTIVPVLNHSIRRCGVANTASYFLRLPDGRRDGSGFSHNEFQSLRKLHASRILALRAVDTSTTYADWSDLSATVAEIVRREQMRGSPITVHANDPNAAINPGDHSDHQMAGLLATALRTRAAAEVIYYVGYALAARPDNRTPAQRREKSALFLAYDREMLLANRMWSTYAERPRFYSMCMLRTYARKVRAPRAAT
jgi:LmbE family N-acetylglucosaminyl deacetylase